MNFERAFEKLLGHEGGFVDHPKDPGGSTRYGITQRVAQATKWLQRAAGAADDGIIGPKTILAVRMADPHKLAARFNGHRLRFLTDLKTWPDFGRGWARRIADNLMGA